MGLHDEGLGANGFLQEMGRNGVYVNGTALVGFKQSVFQRQEYWRRFM
jgi:hypothetical protein